MGNSGQREASRRVVHRIQVLRKRAGFSAERLAQLLTESGYQITAAAITKQERAIVVGVTVDYAFAAAKVLGVTVERLLGLEECARCHGQPPAGFACMECGVHG